MKNGPPPSPPKEPAKAEQVLVLPGSLFFIESVEVPPALTAAEIADFAELSLESIAPFPIEQLCWGYLHTEDAETLLLYATHRDRLKNAGYAELNAYVWVLPDFATLAGACFPEQTEVTFKSANSIALIHFEKGDGIPRAVVASPLSETDDQQVLVKSLRTTAPALNATADSRSISPGPIEVDQDGLPTFTHSATDSADNEVGAWSALAPSEKQLWQADVRSTDFKSAERSNRRISARLIQITGWAAIFALVLIGAEILLLASQTWLGTRYSLIESQRSAVLTIEDNQRLMNKLEQVAQNELRPVAILEALNDIRPPGIYFTSTETDVENQITIDGIANTINELNRYIEVLNKSGRFELIGDPKQITRSGNTTFTVTLAYEHAKEEAAPVAQTEEAAEIQ